MESKRHVALFNRIASVYGLFFNYQIKSYKDIFKKGLDSICVSQGSSFLDIGCGTGALCHSLAELGYKATGVDAAQNMIEMARRKNDGNGIKFEIGDVLKGLDFEDKSFDIVISSFVAHGLAREDRYKLYREASRLARDKVIFHDYSRERRVLTDIAEWMEGGNYFNFIKAVPDEMNGCFSKVEMFSMGKWTSWYICTP